MVDIARKLNPVIEIVVRMHNDDEAKLFEHDALGKVFVGEHELAHGMSRHILDRMGVHSSGRSGAPG
jgi:CPA2 family monovalent cation:H+ antiporter-2